MVYPRVCGGTAQNSTNLVDLPGLSPRVRGNRFRSLPWYWLTRSIPACAGEPTGVMLPMCWLWVYPRVCGGTPDAP